MFSKFESKILKLSLILILKKVGLFLTALMILANSLLSKVLISLSSILIIPSCCLLYLNNKSKIPVLPDPDTPVITL